MASEPAQTHDAIEVSEAALTPDVAEEYDPADNKTTPKIARLPVVPDSMNPIDKTLIQSAYKGNLEEVKAMVEKGADVNLADTKGRTPLLFATYNKHFSIVEFLVSNDADVNLKDGDNQTALMYASRRSNNNLATFLLNNGAEVNVRSKKRGITALMLASAKDNVELVQVLLDNGADPATRDNFGLTAADYAKKMDYSAIVDLLSSNIAPEAES